jgi:hypothetical protein
MGKKGGLYENWLKAFTINVMTQSFHAFFLMFIMQMLSILDKVADAESGEIIKENDGLVAIMSIVGMMALIKFEKLFKKLFGLEDAISGDLKGAGAKMFMGLQAAANLQREIKEPFKKTSESKKRMTSLGKEAGLTKTGRTEDGRRASRGKIGSYITPTDSAARSATKPELSDSAKALYEKMKEAKKNGNMDEYREYRQYAANQMKYDKLKQSGAAQAPAGAYAPAAGAVASQGAQVAAAPGKTQKQKEQEYNDAVLEYRQNRRKQWVKTAGTLTSLAMGLGGTDELSEALKVADVINDPINKVTSKYIDSGENKTASRFTGESKYLENTLTHAIKQGFQDATRNMRNDEGKLSPGKMTIEIAKSYVTTPINVARNAARSAKVNDIDDI